MSAGPGGGPYETEDQARESARYIIDSPDGAWQDGLYRMLWDACATARVALGAYDQHVLAWLAVQEPATCAVMAGLITRAHALTGKEGSLILAALADAAKFNDRAGARDCWACAVQRGVCQKCAAALDRACEYRRLHHELGGER